MFNMRFLTHYDCNDVEAGTNETLTHKGKFKMFNDGNKKGKGSEVCRYKLE